MSFREQQVLLHLEDGRRVPVGPSEVFLLEAVGDETVVRLRGRRRLRDLRSMGEVLALFPEDVMVQIHRSTAVNMDRVTEVRRRPGKRDWEVKLEPPVNRILPIGRSRLPSLWAAYGEG